jgi:hypothetical protein
MLTKINRQACLEKYPKFPLRWYNESIEEQEIAYPKVSSSFILTLSSKTFKGHSKSVGIELTLLMEAMDIDSLIFLGDTDIAWLFRESDYKPAQEALQFLKDHKVGKRFNGALQVAKATLPSFIRHLCWLVRCNGVLPYIYFTDPAQRILGTICQYGNLHMNAINKTAEADLKRLIPKSKFSYLKNGKCQELFSASGTIKGRAIKVK